MLGQMSEAGSKQTTSTAELYDEWHRPRVEGASPTSPWHLLAAAQLGDVAGLRVLEIGCGVGEFSRLLAERGARVIGADISAVAVKETGDQLKGYEGAEAIVADICAIPFRDESFDLVVSLETIEHSPDPRKALAELVRVTRRGCRLIVSSPNYVNFIGLYRLAKRISGRQFSEAGQPINKWTTLLGTVWRLKRLGCQIDIVDGTHFALPIPFWRSLDISWIDHPHVVAKWVSHQGLVVARRRKGH
jgi:2-polyprenyl-3-methyl-5-hydroxy-6-metoxy-1,4-benzoquinol methylase